MGRISMGRHKSVLFAITSMLVAGLALVGCSTGSSPTEQSAVQDDSPGLTTISFSGAEDAEAGLQVGLLVGGESARSEPVLAATFPANQAATVEFPTESWRVYVAMGPADLDQQIQPVAEVPAAPGQILVFEENGTFAQQQGSQSDLIVLENNSRQFVAAGLSQAITVNGDQSSRPLTASGMQEATELELVAPESVQLVLLSDGEQPGEVFGVSGKNGLTLPVATDASVAYDSSSHSLTKS